ncbi:Transcriptional regulator, LuxR family OS=Tsukamurella paurometabola (strain ATCC 8368 / DSM/ CCUG 35730 / CIP 100753 / JCM 10117 / KCTC 9821 / NBRC 16120/ NCIMB 702349 / NCTC 13040) OX=521096 GN=Tpau_2594 PE=4 SV=1 [Tsukamurella paurometabola]|uniref:Transcriptional regulator, LuxR family n=1 Tax=Tsukamurella paurometabola (strain ATCC 8368 / DSM 20162 / CCUG 35730 / CIP 100753 / JCM 10117 / KCTC 9821 / NBRC 16120 / NCIMB 702349 / NCTC 13040) TaxID=521096 RepID=D5URZ2_TSUPD|nr:LuxR family transcriptional regulator [Tsukamurella paurometabola]ADG79197.1 transcriptional regulator, LuxR family [Tsukamurella paurometabola DSM 20162]SUP34503.1 Spore germination protein gerE [Tsukamurella paurometabola]
MTLVGRDGECARIDRLLAGARADRGGALVVRGEPGIGKSALLEHAAHEAQASGMRVIRGAGIESDAELAHGGLHQLLWPHLARLDALPAPQAAALRTAFGLDDGLAPNRFLVSAGALALFADLSDDAPLLVIVDDLQWLDRGSTEALLFAARRFAADPIAMLFAVRETSMPFVTPGVDTIALDGLRAGDAACILDAHAPGIDGPLRARVLDESAGNPLALIELGSLRKAGDESAPSDIAGPVGALPVSQRVHLAFRGQISALPDATRRALLAAAADSAAPLATTLRVIEALGGGIADLVPAERAGLITVGERILFRHPLVRTAAYRGEPLPHRIDVHRAYAHAAAADADRRAWHLAAATTAPAESVAAELDGVAERARHRGGAMAVSIAYDRAARLSEDGERRGARVALAAQAAYDGGRPDRAQRLASEALALSGDAGVRADAVYVLGAVAYERQSPRADAELTLEAARSTLADDPERTVLALYEAGHAARHGAAGDLLQEVAAVLRDVTPPEEWTPVVEALLGWAELADGRPGHAITRMLPPVVGSGSVPLTHAITAAISGLLTAREDEVVPAVEETLDAARAEGALGWIPYFLGVLAVARLLRGEFADARACVAEGAAVSEELANRTELLAHRSLEVWLLAVSGEEQSCRALAEHVLPEARHRHRVDADIGMWGTGVLDLAAARYADAVVALEAVCTGPARRDVLLRAVPDLVEAAARGGVPERAAGPLADFAEWAEVVGRPVTSGLAQRCRALLADDDEAEELYLGALRLHEEAAGGYDLARTRLVHGEWLRRRRRRTEARAQLDAALAGFEDVGAAAWAQRARNELAALGAPGKGKRSAGPLNLLTPQELQVVRLAAAGNTNKEIAAHLFLSPRTVGYHLYNAYPKLGVAGRGDLAGIVAQERGTGTPLLEPGHRD